MTDSRKRKTLQIVFLCSETRIYKEKDHEH